MKGVTKLLLVACWVVGNVYGQAVYVDAEFGFDTNGGESWESAKQTLQAGIDAASVGGTVYVAAGIYQPIVTTNKLVRIEAVSPNPSDTIIDGGGVKRCATLGVRPQLGQTNTVLLGFTLCNGTTTPRDGQTVSTYGGGVFSGTLINCIIRDCVADVGGGAHDTKLIQCVLKNNTAHLLGGATSRGTLRQCTVVKNKAYVVGGVLNSTVENSIVWDNNSTNTSYGTQFDNYLESTFAYSCTTPMPSGADDLGGNIEQDPLFVDAANGDFRLRGNSPCLDTGTNTYAAGIAFDLDGNPRVINDTVDMGAYELQEPEFYISSYDAWRIYYGLGDTPENGDKWLAGLDPLDNTSVFHALIDINDGRPVVSWRPDLREKRTYTLLASPTLDTPVAEWEEFATNNIPDTMRFFKVRVDVAK